MLSLWPGKARLCLAISTPQLSTMADALLSLAREIATMGTALATESIRLARKVSLLIHLLEEIRDFAARSGGKASLNSSASSSPWSCLADLPLALEAVKKFLLLSGWKNAGKCSNLVSLEIYLFFGAFSCYRVDQVFVRFAL